MPAYFTQNLCVNPSFEAGIAGYTALAGATLAQDTTTAQYGTSSMLVTTPGVVAGEGFAGPVVTGLAGQTCSVSLYVAGGAGSLTVAAVSDAGLVLVSGNYPLAAPFTRIQLNSLAVTGSSLYVMAVTSAQQSISFWVDAVQYEADAAAHPYCDGDQPGCFWTGTPEASASFQPYQFFIATEGTSQFSGSATVINLGEVFTLPEDVGTSQFGGSAVAKILSPIAAFNDFAIFELTDLDPAQTYVSWNNAGVMTGYDDYALAYAMFVPPLDYVVSGGEYLWRRAAFAAFGWSFAAVPAGACENLTDVQVEFARFNGSGPILPSPFQPPRQIQTNLAPDRLNLCTNPSFEVSVANWSATGAGSSLARASGMAVQDAGVYGGVTYSAGTSCMQVNLGLPGTGLGASTAISKLVVGETYIASAYVQTGLGLDDVTMTIADGYTDLAHLGGSGYGAGGYGAGGYGGVWPAGLLRPVPWTRLSCVFTADSDTDVLTITALVDPAAAFPLQFWVDAVLVEAGSALQPYFDGSFGSSAFWEVGGVAGLSRSYLAPESALSQAVIGQVLTQNVPLGISFATPAFGQPPAG